MFSNSAKGKLRLYQLIVLAVSLLLWYALTSPTLLPAIYSTMQSAAFFSATAKKCSRASGIGSARAVSMNISA